MKEREKTTASQRLGMTFVENTNHELRGKSVCETAGICDTQQGGRHLYKAARQKQDEEVHRRLSRNHTSEVHVPTRNSQYE